MTAVCLNVEPHGRYGIYCVCMGAKWDKSFLDMCQSQVQGHGAGEEILKLEYLQRK